MSRIGIGRNDCRELRRSFSDLRRMIAHMSDRKKILIVLSILLRQSIRLWKESAELHSAKLMLEITNQLPYFERQVGSQHQLIKIIFPLQFNDFPVKVHENQVKRLRFSPSSDCRFFVDRQPPRQTRSTQLQSRSLVKLSICRPQWKWAWT